MEPKKIALTLDMKKQRIRIHKHTLHQLGDPDYIQLLVNPEQKSIVLKACPEGSFFAHRVICKKDADCELYSKEFLQQLKTVDNGLKKDVSFQIEGQVYPSHRIALFRLEDVLPVSLKLPSQNSKGAPI